MKTIRKVLVANRGEIARRVFRTCREMGIGTVAVFSEPDRDALFVREADEAAPLGGASPADSYLRGEAIVEAAVRAGADAVHPGYGFLAENAGFARRVAEAGLVFIGPPPDAIDAMGSKLAARTLMQHVGVPVLPAVELGEGGAALRAAAARIGLPAMVKASAGGGGRGMRVVRDPADLEEAVRSARREAKAAFGDDTVFLERRLDSPRHVEVQVFGDGHGNVVSLFERECSIQRRHQKVVEESPSPAVDERLRDALGAAAVAAARAVSYVGAGTVEFLLAEREFFFLEMNTRLQVEHPVTEAVTGLDLVRLQIHVAEGDVLPREAMAARIAGHAIEARLYAEDPENGFLPVSGRLHRFRLPEGPGLRVDAGVADGSVVGTDYDPLLAKVVVHAPTRAEAASRLADALSRARIHGLVTNRDLLVGILRRLEFLDGRTDTGFLERHSPSALLAAAGGAETDRLHAVVAALAAAAARRGESPVLGSLPSGWRNNPSALQEVAFEGRSGRIAVGYAWRRDGLVLRVDGAERPGARARAAPDHVDLELDGVRRGYEVHRVGDVHYVDSPLGHSVLRETPRFPEGEEDEAAGSLRAPMPGRVIRVALPAGSAVERGTVLVVLEAMKMEHQVVSPRAGVLREVRVAEGQQVDAGEVLAVLDGPD